MTLSKPQERRQFADCPEDSSIHQGPLARRTYNVQVIQYQPGFNFDGFTTYLGIFIPRSRAAHVAPPGPSSLALGVAQRRIRHSNRCAWT